MERFTQYHVRLTERCNAHNAESIGYARAKGNPCMLLLLLISPGLVLNVMLLSSDSPLDISCIQPDTIRPLPIRVFACELLIDLEDE